MAVGSGTAAVAAILTLCVALVGCDAGSGGVRASFPECPTGGLPHVGGHALVHHAAGVVRVPPSTRTAQVCLYSLDDTNGRGHYVLTRSVELAPRLSRTLARLLALGIKQPARDSCVDDPVVLRLGDDARRIRSFMLAGCSPAFATRGRAAAVVSRMAAGALGGLGGIPADPPVRKTPNFIGRRLEAAMHAARLRHVELYPHKEIEDPTVVLGTVVWQTPIFGTPQDADSVQVSAYVGVPRSPPCRARQLRGRYLNGGLGTGTHFGSIGLLNVSPGPCTLEGRLTLDGQDAHGRTVTNSISQPSGDRLVLSPRVTPAELRAAGSSGLTGTFSFSGNERDDPKTPDGLCRDETRPASWTVQVGPRVSVVFPNGGRGAGGSFYSCHGEISFESRVHLSGSG